MKLNRSLVPAAALTLVATCAAAQQVTKPTVEGVTNFVKLESSVACAGATKAMAVPEIKKMGFASMINVRVPTEPGAEIEETAAAAKAAGIRFYNIPFSNQSPDPAAVDKFVTTITTPGNEPAYISCGSGNRAAMMWMVKRMTVDHWDAEKAGQEAAALGLTSPTLKQFAIDYAQSHKR